MSSKFVLQQEDGTIANGDARGEYAVDLQMVRTNNGNIASGISSLVFGYDNRASGNYSFAGGNYRNYSTGDYSFSFGSNNKSYNLGAITMGLSNVVNNQYGIAMGRENTVSGNLSVVFGDNNTAGTYYGTISGGRENTTSSNYYATVVGGSSNSSTGQYSITGGYSNVASGQGSVALGYDNTASGTYSIAIGRGNTASGQGAVAIGGGYASSEATASGDESFAMGQGALANNVQSFAFGSNQKAYLHHGFVHGFTRFAKGEGQYQDTTVQNEGSLSSAGTLSLLKDSAYPWQGSGLIPDGNNRAWNVTVKWVAVCTATGSGTTAVGAVAIATDSFMFKRVSGTSSIGTVQNLQNSQDATMAGATCSYAVGGSQDLQITFTAPASANATTFRVVAKVELTECAW